MLRAMDELPALAGVTHEWYDLPTGVRAHVALAGSRDAPGGTLILQHGWPQHWYVWRRVIGSLARDFHVVVPDLRGFGWSEQPADGDFRKQRLVDDALALIDTLELERVGWVGHDWGGWTGFLLAERAPERLRGLLALNIIHPWWPRRRLLAIAPRLWYQAVMAMPGLGSGLMRHGRFTEAGLTLRFGSGTPIEPDAKRSFVAALSQPEQARAASLLYRQFVLQEAPGLFGRTAPHLRVPVRVVFGVDDPALDYRMLRGLPALCDDCGIELVADCGHFIVDERPALVATRARTFFETV